MEIVVRISEGHPGRRRHYCTALHRTVAAGVDGVPADARVYCPLCGAMMTNRRPDLRSGHVDKHPEFLGPRCRHGYLDLPCADIAAAHPECEWEFRTAVPEYRALLAARSRGCAASLERFVRPCALCRRALFEQHAAAVESELRELCRGLAQDSRASQSALERTQDELNLVHAVLYEATALPASPEGDGPALGYVYAISDGSAIKIGWTATHPGMPGGRLAQLQTAHSAELTLIGAERAAVHRESELHRRFSEHRIRGEWFRYVPAIVEYFDPR